METPEGRDKVAKSMIGLMQTALDHHRRHSEQDIPETDCLNRAATGAAIECWIERAGNFLSAIPNEQERADGNCLRVGDLLEEMRAIRVPGEDV